MKIIDLPDLSRNYRSAAHAVACAVEELEAALSGSAYWLQERGRTYFELRRDLPYGIQETELPGTQILVNRQYMPLGNPLKKWGTRVAYEDYQNLHVRLTPEEITNILGPRSQTALFDDGSAPWLGRKVAKAYLVRLKLLLERLDRSSHPLVSQATA